MTGPVLGRLPQSAAVALIRLRSLGDCVLTTPALSILKEARPDLRVAVVVEPRFAAVFEGNPEVDEILPPETLELARWRPRLTINLHGGTRSAQLTVASLAPLRAGFTHFRFQALYNVRIPRAQEILGVERKVHTVEHLASVMFYLGAPQVEIPQARMAVVTRASACAQPYAVLHPIASAPDKTWPADRFLKTAHLLRDEFGFEPVFIGGPGDDLSAFERFLCLKAAPLSEVKNLLAGAALFIGNDSGPAHMAAAFGIPVIVLFGSSDPEIWGPWKTPSAVLSLNDGAHAVMRAVPALVPAPVATQ